MGLMGSREAPPRALVMGNAHPLSFVMQGLDPEKLDLSNGLGHLRLERWARDMRLSGHWTGEAHGFDTTVLPVSRRMLKMRPLWRHFIPQTSGLVLLIAAAVPRSTGDDEKPCVSSVRRVLPSASWRRHTLMSCVSFCPMRRILHCTYFPGAPHTASHGNYTRGGAVRFRWRLCRRRTISRKRTFLGTYKNILRSSREKTGES